MRSRQGTTIQGAALLLLFVLFLTVCLPCAAQALETEKRTVRIGYYPITEYQDKAEDGTYSGFSYDYYMQIQKYTGWNYEFVEANYADCMKMLLTGELDIVSGVIPTDARSEQMSFSHYSVSNTQNKLYARAEDENCFYESYAYFDGKKAAILRGTLADDLLDYEARHDFSMTLVQYDSLTEMEEALLRGEVDLLYGTSITKTADTKIVARMDKISLHYAVAKNQPEILSELDDALQKIIDNNPYFYTQMTDKYMVSGANAMATFTKEEYDYIQSGQPVYVIMNDNWEPLSWYDEKTEAYQGIVPDVLQKITEYSGLQFTLCSQAEYETMRAENADIDNNVLGVLADDTAWANKQGVMMSNHITDSSVVMVTKRSLHQGDFKQEELRFALPENYYVSWKTAQTIPEENITYYATIEECLNAVNTGKADAAYMNELMSSYYLSMLEYSDLFATANAGYDENLAFAVNRNTDQPLLGIIDKALLCIGSDALGQILIQNSVAKQRITVGGLFYSNPLLFFTIIAVIMLVLIGIFVIALFLTVKRRHLAVELEREQENASARTEFFMMISHELRTPLNAIVGYLNMALELCPRESAEMEYIRRSQGAAKQLTAVAEDMLDYTCIASSSAKIRAELFDLKEVVYHVGESISLKAEKQGVSFSFAVQNIDYEYVIGDKLRVAQIMQNLLSNSVKFTAAGGQVHASLEQSLTADGELTVRFSARDTGKGMSLDFLKKVCAPFNQDDPSYSRTHGGLGLGLFLTKYYLEAMGGQMAVESELGKGSCFTVTIPLAKPNSEQLLQENVDYSHVRALIGGADAESNGQLKALLKRLKMKCDVVTSPEQVERRIRGRLSTDYAYSLCVLDENLLETDAALPEKLLAIDGAPLLFLMRDGQEPCPVPAEMQARCRVLSKPIFQSVLFDAVMTAFGAYEPDTPHELPDFGGLHAMLAEDNSVNADILAHLLQKMNIAVTICENGALAVEEYANNPENTFDIIFMDIQMPVMNGYEATERIRGAGRIDSAVLPIVAVSANAFPEDKRKSLESGMNEHLSKPIHRDSICRVIQTYCRRAQPETK